MLLTLSDEALQLTFTFASDSLSSLQLVNRRCARIIRSINRRAPVHVHALQLVVENAWQELDTKTLRRLAATDRRIRSQVLDLASRGRPEKRTEAADFRYLSYASFVRLFPPDVSQYGRDAKTSTTSDASRSSPSSHREAMYGLRTRQQMAYLEEAEERLRKKFSTEELVAGAARFEEAMAKNAPDAFCLDSTAPPGTRLRLIEPKATRAFMRSFFQPLFQPTTERPAETFTGIFVFDDDQLNDLETMDATDPSDVVVYLWTWTDPKTDMLYYYIGSSKNAPKRIGEHRHEGVNHLARSLLALPHFSAKDIKSYVVYYESSRAPSSIVYAAECIFNVFFGATMHEDVQKGRCGINVNVLDASHFASSISHAEFNTIWDNTVNYFKTHDTPKIPQRYDAKLNPLPYLPLLEAVTDDPDFTALALVNLLRGLVAVEMGRDAQVRNPLPATAYAGLLVPERLDPTPLRVETQDHRAALRQIRSAVPDLDPKANRIKTQQELALQRKHRAEEEALFADAKPAAARMAAAAGAARTAKLRASGADKSRSSGGKSKAHRDALAKLLGGGLK
ncbi:hypothetical protein RHOSPDRAFT_32475 [Rhodotorula sp. JG-1b]|nr:hypothetical protein RHOSPDRAFT_32475 [Rhodotorula sp. JG-1b]